MIRCRNSLIVVGLFVVFAYTAQPDNGWFADKLHPCTGDSVWVTESLDYNDATQQEIITLTVLGMSRVWSDWMSYEAERSGFIHHAIELAALQCGSGGATSLPAVAAVSTFQHTVFTNTVRPRAASIASGQTGARMATPASSMPAGEAVESTLPPEPATESGKAVDLAVVKKEAGTKPTLPPNNVTTDLEWCAFSHLGTSGNNFSVRASYQRTLANEKITLGGTAVVNTMIMMDKLFFNNAINLSGTYLLTETSSLERKIGGSINTFIVDKEFYGTPFGLSAVVSFSDNWFVNQDNIVTYGGMIQQSMVGDMKTTLLTAGVLFGLPLLDRYALNPSCVLAYNVLTMGKNGAVDIESPLMLQPALNGSIYFSRLFTLDVGAKTTLLLKEYGDFILTIGATILF
ncbi:MAG: hypothetical protein JXA71_03850 [Chitinispirillaceae bacterium]|nr:hypothetical protein [Chitinispirillaceae bacterium]